MWSPPTAGAFTARLRSPSSSASRTAAAISSATFCCASSVDAPRWGVRTALSSDRSGWWNLERIRDGARSALHPATTEFGYPAWTFGSRSYSFLADGRIVTGRQGIESKLIDAIGGEPEAIAWLQSDKQVAEDLPVYTYYPSPKQSWFDLSQFLGQSARAALGLSETGPIALDGLVSLWQVGPSM